METIDELRPEFIEKMKKRQLESTVKIKNFRKFFGKAKAKTSYREERKIREKVGKEFAKKFGIKLD